MRRSISAMTLALAIGILSISIPVASAATSARLPAAPGSPGKFGVRLVDAPVSQAGNPRALEYIIDYLPTGTVIHRRILIMNEEPLTSRFVVYPAAAHITGGQFTGYSGAARNELTRWVSVQHPVVTLAPGASVTDMVTIKVPPGATRGEHYGIVWVQQRASTQTRTKFAVIEVARVGIRMYVAVGRGGAPPTSFDITSITGRWSPAGHPIIDAHVNNTGGRALDLNGTASLAGGPGNTSSGPFHAQKIVTLAPGQSGNITFAAPSSLPQGFWRATVTLASGLTTAKATTTILLAERLAAQVGLSGAQRIGLGLGGLVLVLMIVMWWYMLRHRRRRALPTFIRLAFPPSGRPEGGQVRRAGAAAGPGGGRRWQ